MRLLFLPAFAALAALPAAAQPAADTTLPAVTVTAARLLLAPHEAPARVTLLDRQTVESSASTNVADLLDARAPLFVRRYGASGLATVALRGTSAGQTLILLDGRRLADPQLGQLDLSLLPTVLLEAAEVLHGSGAALHGADALGGVVHLRAVGPDANERIRLTSEAGAWGARRLGLVATGGVGRLAAVVAADAERADEDFRYHDGSRIGEPLVRNAGWDRRRASGYAALAYTHGPTTLRAATLAADAERGLGGTDSVGARQWDRTLRLWLDGAHRTAWGRLEAGGFAQRTRLRYASPFPAPHPAPDILDETGRTTAAGLDLRAHLRPLPGWTATAVATLGLGTADHPSLRDDATDRYAALALSAARTTGRLRLFPALRLDAYAPAGGTRRAVLSPHLGANVQPFDTDALRLKTSAGRVFRMPTLNDRFWQPGGDPDLRPERGWTVDAGLSWTAQRLQAELTAFAAAAHDQIVWRPTEAGYWRPENVARTRTIGLEASTAATLSGGLQVGAAAALTDARDRSDPAASSFGQPLRYVPRATAKAWAALGLGPLRLDLGARYTGRRFTTTDGSQSLAPHLVLDAQARVAHDFPRVRAGLGFVVENLTDRRYEVVQSYVMPPRHLRARLTLKTR